jgi:murein DD-endopeptidase MepM/ murein hydrolase activator NlpD
MKFNLIVLIGLLFFNCNNSETRMDEPQKLNVILKSKLPNQRYFNFFKNNPDYVSDGFDFPVGKPDAKGYYNAQPFMKNAHLGDDWNATTGGNTDLGHPIFAISNGIVSEVTDYGGGWGKVLRIVHQLPNGELRESLYAHCQEMFVDKNDAIKKGDKVATIGNAGGIYYAHLHLEMRWKIDAPLGGGYAADTSGYLNPTEFIRKFRQVRK